MLQAMSNLASALAKQPFLMPIQTSLTSYNVPANTQGWVPTLNIFSTQVQSALNVKKAVFGGAPIACPVGPASAPPGAIRSFSFIDMADSQTPSLDSTFTARPATMSLIV